MRFIDEAKIRVLGGKGGPGSVSFRRETFAPRGGPDGGDGGDGGDIIFEASAELGTLQDLRFKRLYQAPNGMHGSGANKAGREGENIVVRVPVGTLIKNTETGEILTDFTEDRQTWVACKGGRGGKGNTHFVSSTHQAPKFAQPGEEGQSAELTLELKLLADVGIIGFPNAGKSTLISKMSAAKPKIADYPFTTLTPHLGVVSLPDLQTFVVADIPGLVEGAHRGFGLGHKFLKHIERTSLFVHLLDGAELLFQNDFEDLESPLEERAKHQEELENAAMEKLLERYLLLRKELGLFSETLLHKPEIVVLNKIDILDANPEFVAKIQKHLRSRIASIRGTHPIPGEPFVISAATGNGVASLVFTLFKELKEQKDSRHFLTQGPLLPDSLQMRQNKRA